MISDAILAAILARLERALAPPSAPLVPLRIDGQVAGRLTPERAQRMAALPDIFVLDAGTLAFVPALADPARRSEAMHVVAALLAHEGALSAWRDELYAAAPAWDAEPWFQVERAAARYFGIRTYAAHVNGLVRSGDDLRMWIARRSATKAIDPGMLDNLVGGGIAAHTSVRHTVVKEAWEEAGIAESIAAQADPVGTLHVVRLLPDGLQDETLFVHDLWLPQDFVPENQDGEALGHRCLGLDAIAPLIAADAGPLAMTGDAALVAFDCLVRQGVASPIGSPVLRLRG